MHILDEPGVCKNDLIQLFVGEYIGGGCSRHVYSYRPDPKQLVIKVEYGDQSFQNVIENEIWQNVRYTKWAKWFAPIESISSCGLVMVQRRTFPLNPDNAPEKIPNFMTDLKYTNFGILDGHVCAHDYGYSLMMSRGIGAARMKKAEWWD